MTTTPANRLLSFTRAEPKPTKFGNLLNVEFRKLFSTQGMQVLFGVSILTILLVATATTIWHEALFGPAEDQPFWQPWAMVAFLIRMAAQFLIPAFVVLFATSEWTTRSVMTTFTLAPKRSLVIAAKAVVVLVLGVATWALTAGAAVLSTYLGRTMNDVPLDDMWVGQWQTLGDLTSWLLLLASAFGLGLLLQNGALAVAIALVGPMVVQILRQFSEVMRDLFAWVDLQTMSQVVLNGGDKSHVPQLLVASLVWVLVPLALGTWRTLKREAS